MSESVSSSEPSTLGRVVLKTTKGDMTVELWSKECPRTCRNFIQLCLEGYYNGTIFHRIIPGYVIQGGDPTGTGTGGSSIYDQDPLTSEIHSRLRFRHRGMLGMASGSNESFLGSQFFITLAASDDFNGKYTLFGKLVANSIYSALEIAETAVDKTDRPVGSNPPRIISTEVVENPFEDIVPRTVAEPWKRPDVQKTSQPIVRERVSYTRGSKLSFQDDEADEGDDMGIQQSSSVLKGKPAVLAKKQPEIEVRVARSSSIGAQNNSNSSKSLGQATQSSSNIQDEINRLKSLIQACDMDKQATGPPTPEKTMRDVRKRQKMSETQVLEKFTQWTNSIADSMPSSDTACETSVTSFGSGSDWLKTLGSVKFAVDSKSAFERI